MIASVYRLSGDCGIVFCIQRSVYVKVCFTGGGTGGHVFPAFAVDNQLQLLLAQEGEPYHRFWIGSGKKEEREWVESAGIPYYAIRSGKLRRYVSWRFFPDMVAIVIGFWQALFLLHREKPAVLFSKGGYVSVPPVLAAKLLRIPAVTHESDAIPGLATKINALFVSTICIPFASVALFFPARMHKKFVVTGVPTRLSRRRAKPVVTFQTFNLRPERNLIVVLGGSQGAAQINRLIWDNLEAFLALGDIVHQCGLQNYQKIEREGYYGIPFITEGLEDLLRAATIVISRSGATALADFLEMEVPMILIPLGLHASRGDQLENARRLVDFGAAQVFEEDVHGAGELIQLVEKVLKDGALRQEMIRKSRLVRVEGATQQIAQMILETSRTTRTGRHQYE